MNWLNGEDSGINICPKLGILSALIEGAGSALAGRRRLSFHLPRQLIVRNPLADDTSDRNVKPLAVSQRAMVEAVRLLVEVAEQVERLDGNVGSLQAALQKRPE